MATKTLVQLVDDLDGSEASESIQFALDGVTFEIDLNEDHADAMRDAFAPYIDAGRRTGGRSSRPTIRRTVLPAQKAPIGTSERHAIQRFARANGFKEPAERGRIATTILDAWEEAGRPM